MLVGKQLSVLRALIISLLFFALFNPLVAQPLETTDTGVFADGYGLSLAVAPGNQPSLTYFNRQSGQIRFSRLILGVWQTETIGSTSVSASNISEHQLELHFRNNIPHVFSVDSSGTLRLFVNEGSTWQTAVVASAVTPGSLDVIECGAEICFSFQDVSTSTLKLGRGLPGAWDISDIDSESGQGEMTSLGSFSDGRLVVAYYDSNSNKLRVAKELGQNTWTRETINHFSHNFGAWPSLVVTPDNALHISSSRLDENNRNDDIGVYYARQRPGEVWEIGLLSDDFIGGKTHVSINQQGEVSVAQRYTRYSESFGDETALELAALDSSGQWETERIWGSAGIYSISELNMDLDFFGNKVLASNYSRGEAFGESSQDAIRMFKAIDSDGDGLPDEEESLYGTSSSNADSDGDGFLDGVEVTVYGTDPNSFDSEVSQSDSDGDGILDIYDNDDDNDGLSDQNEAFYGTDSRVADTDGDGILDGEEVVDGSNPLDASSFIDRLATTLCGEWNGFLGDMWNVFELVNLGYEPLRTTTTLYDINGESVSSRDCFISAGGQCDLLVHDMEGRESDSYGKICVSHSGGAGDLDGQMVYYRPGFQGDFEFAFAMPLSNGLQGRQVLSYNTFQPSSNPLDAANLVANWVQIINLSSDVAEGQLVYYDQFGNIVSEKQVSLLPEARQDFPAHEVGAFQYGMMEWIPEDDTQRFQIRNVRYLYDRPGSISAFQSAFQIAAAKGSISTLTAPLDTRGQSSIVEIMNTSEQATTVDAVLYDMEGRERESYQLYIEAKASFHLITDGLLGDSGRGRVSIKSNTDAGIAAVVMQYERDETGSISSLYGVSASDAIGVTLRGSYNTFLDQDSEIVLVNNNSLPASVNFSLIRGTGAAIVLGYQFEVPANGLRIVQVRDFEFADNYGVATVHSSNVGAWIIRRRAGEFNIPTRLR